MSNHTRNAEASTHAADYALLADDYARPRFRSRRLRRFGWMNYAKSTVICVAVGAAAVSGGYMVTNGETVAASIHQVPGFQVNKFVVNGNQQVAADDIALRIGLSGGKSLLELDVEEARLAIKENPKISEARVRKIYPDQLIVDLVEREPFALWQIGGELRLVARDGVVMEAVDGEPPVLPQIVGVGANEVAAELMAEMAKYPMIQSRVSSYIRVGSRRWNLTIADGPRILLPETDWQVALGELYALQSSLEVLDRDIVQLDMRLPDRLVVRLRPDLARSREEAIANAIKNVQGRRT